MIQPGEHRAICTGPGDVQWGESSNGNLQVALVFQLLDEPNIGRRISWVGTFGSGRSSEITLNALENCGWDGLDPAESLEGIDRNEVMLVVEHEYDNQGRPWPRVRWVNKLGNAKIKFKQPLSGREVKARGASLKADVLARRRAQGRPVGGAQVPPARYRNPNYDTPNSPDDDIPF